jgi:hypothetical protein
MANEPKGKRTIIAEDELGKHVRTTKEIPHTLEGMEAAAARINADDFGSDMVRLARECDDVLSAANLPKVMDTVGWDDEGTWWHPDPNTIRHPRLIIGKLFVEKFAEGFSDEWYAAEIGYLCHKIHGLREKNEPDHFALSIALHIGMLLRDWDWRGKYKPAILSRMNTQKRFAGGRSAHNEIRYREVQQRRNKIVDYEKSRDRPLLGKARIDAIRNHLSSQHDIHVGNGTIYRDLKAIE